MYFSNAFLLTSFLFPIFITNGHPGSLNLSCNVLIPILLYAAASSTVRFIFSHTGISNLSLSILISPSFPLLLLCFCAAPPRSGQGTISRKTVVIDASCICYSNSSHHHTDNSKNELPLWIRCEYPEEIHIFAVKYTILQKIPFLLLFSLPFAFPHFSNGFSISSGILKNPSKFCCSGSTFQPVS